jgi:hypothetical protein
MAILFPVISLIVQSKYGNIKNGLYAGRFNHLLDTDNIRIIPQFELRSS